MLLFAVIPQYLDAYFKSLFCIPRLMVSSFYELWKPMHDGGFPYLFPISINQSPFGTPANLSKVSFYPTRLTKEKW
jgi:hypothetical protein